MQKICYIKIALDPVLYQNYCYRGADCKAHAKECSQHRCLSCGCLHHLLPIDIVI